jgi:tetratricopeptide (TPR) repeat protein
MGKKHRGVAYADLKQFEKAIQDYNQAIELDPKYTHAFNNRGTAYIKLKQFEKAIQDYNQAIELDPELDGFFKLF